LTPIGFLLSGTILAVTVRISEPLGFLPVARQTVFDSLEDGVLVVDGNGQVIDANASAATMFEGECMGAGIDTILPDQVFDGESLGADLATGVEVELDRGGERRWYLVRSRTIQQGIRTPGRVLTFTDVTERKRRERMLEQKNQQLEGVADVISHDVQTPLATAKRSRRLIEGELDDPDPAVSESLATIERSHDRLSNLSEHLLVLAREGEPVGESHPVDLESVAADAWEIVDADSQTLEIDGTRTLDADRTRLRQLFENLFRNARDHGGNTVRVGTTPDTFFVEDDGPGLPAGAAETIFEYGYTTEHGNTGLGLAIVESIAAGHGWEVRASEAESGGARFEVRTDP
jgi:PAS domain S-box-containing protein